MKFLLSWHGLIISYTFFIAVLLMMSGCSTHHVLRVGDTTYSAGVSLNKEVSDYE